MTKNLPEWLTFSIYEQLDNLGGSLNPLGLQSSQTAIANYLFPQFTTLTRDPRNHNILCGLLLGLKQAKIPMRSYEARIAENLWGLLQSALVITDKTYSSPLNIEKYSGLLKGNNFRVNSEEAIKSRLKDRLGYGLYGFYIQPSVKWGFVQSDGRTLTELGEEMGTEFNEATGFGKLLKEWLKDPRRTFDFSKQLDIARNTAIGTMERRESAIWKKILSDVKRKESRFKAVWDNLPIKNEISSTKLKKIFSDNNDVVQTIDLEERFEKLAAYVNFFFDLIYIFSQNKEILKDKNTNIEQIFITLKEEMDAALDSYKSFNTLNLPKSKFFMQGDFTTYTSFTNWLIENHKSVQRSKGKSPYFDENLKVVQYDQKNLEACTNVLDKGVSPSAIYKQYSIDWRFSVASHYKRGIYE
jgi:hypothetical protein